MISTGQSSIFFLQKPSLYKVPLKIAANQTIKRPRETINQSINRSIPSVMIRTFISSGFQTGVSKLSVHFSRRNHLQRMGKKSFLRRGHLTVMRQEKWGGHETARRKCVKEKNPIPSTHRDSHLKAGENGLNSFGYTSCPGWACPTKRPKWSKVLFSAVPPNEITPRDDDCSLGSFTPFYPFYSALFFPPFFLAPFYGGPIWSFISAAIPVKHSNGKLERPRGKKSWREDQNGKVRSPVYVAGINPSGPRLNRFRPLTPFSLYCTFCLFLSLPVE